MRKAAESQVLMFPFLPLIFIFCNRNGSENVQLTAEQKKEKRVKDLERRKKEKEEEERRAAWEERERQKLEDAKVLFFEFVSIVESIDFHNQPKRILSFPENDSSTIRGATKEEQGFWSFEASK